MRKRRPKQPTGLKFNDDPLMGTYQAAALDMLFEGMLSASKAGEPERVMAFADKLLRHVPERRIGHEWIDSMTMLSRDMPIRYRAIKKRVRELSAWQGFAEAESDAR
ncbi:hypothetical protein [Maricaulis sp.]|uniref:hypothetical protein n=1 Tax=Maricaulis sp. TaxID=1486257 RepID=UPI003A8F28BB